MNIYFAGIGGVGIGPLAEIARDAGYNVQGSDQHKSPVTESLAAQGIGISFNQDGTFLQGCHEAAPIDWFIHTSALPADHPELQMAQTLGIKTAKRDELLALILREKNLKLIAVAGTHGKTTTTGMLIWAFKQLGIPISYSVGATLSFGPSGAYSEGSEYFIYECDEFDRNFLHFSPHLALITSIGYDHSDTYRTKEIYLEAFRQFVRQSSHIIMWRSDDTDISPYAPSSWVLGDNEVASLALPGEHVRRNATLVLKALEYLQVGEVGERPTIIEQFPGTSRRFERLAERLYSDYAHHPREIAATLQLARELSDSIVLVYQPHQNTRQYEIKNEYGQCFDLAETVYWLPTYLSREDPNLPILTPSELVSAIKNHDNIHIADTNDELWQKMTDAGKAGKLVLVMGAGSIDSWLRSRLKF